MKKKLAAIIGTLCLLAFAGTQQAAPTPDSRPELPPGPLLKNAPDFARWVVTRRSSAPAKAGGKARPERGDYRMIVTKTKPLFHVEIATGSGARADKWCFKDLQITTASNAQYPILSSAGNKDPYYQDFSKSDFAGFDWLSAANFVEVKKVSGTDCLIFKNRIRTASGEHADAEAVIDLKTREPILLQVGDTVTTFEYHPPPTAALTPPENVLALAKQRRERLRRASLLPPP